jgi:hypothetical protein
MFNPQELISGFLKDQNKEPKKDQRKRSPIVLRIEIAVIFALAGSLISGCSVLENRAKERIASAGVPPAVANDPDLIWQASNGATDEELRSYANSLLLGRERELNQAMATQQAEKEAAAFATPTATQEPEINEFKPKTQINFEKITDGVYSFQTDSNIEITDPGFILYIKNTLKKLENLENIRVFISVIDDATGVTQIVLDSTASDYKEANGPLFAYVGDKVFIAADGAALTELLDSQGIKHKTFGLP